MHILYSAIFAFVETELSFYIVKYGHRMERFNENCIDEWWAWKSAFSVCFYALAGDKDR